MFTILVNRFGVRPLIIRFRDEKLRKLCEQRRAMVRKHGDLAARKLRARLEDLASATCVTELPAGRPHELRGDRAGQYAVALHGGLRLVFEPSVQPPPASEHGGIDWNAVDHVTIVAIEDYHD